jgi:hypothetical protein
VPRLRLDRLEDREVPATWNPGPGSDYLATTAANWDFGYGESISYFRTATFNSANTAPCLDFSGDFDAVNVNPGYTGDIILNGDLTVAMFYQGDGTIDQPLGSGSEITITQWWGWEGGTLNSTQTASTVTFDGSLYPGMAMANIAPAGYGTVTTGSTLNLINGATVTFYPGTIDFVGGDGMNVVDSNASCQPATLGPPVPAPKITFNRGTGQITYESSTWDINTPTGGNMAVYLNHSTVIVRAGQTGEFGHSVVIAGLPEQNSVVLNYGLILIEKGADPSARSRRHRSRLRCGRMSSTCHRWARPQTRRG